MSFKIKVSKSGFDVLDATDAKNFIFDSDFNHLKTAGSGSYTQAMDTTDRHTTTIAHGLAYRPLAMAYWRDTANSKWLIASADPEDTVGRHSINASCGLYCDATNIYIRLWNYTGGTTTFEVKYEFFYEGDA